MANFNDFLNTKSDPMQSDLTKNSASPIQGVQLDTPNKSDINVQPQQDSSSSKLNIEGYGGTDVNKAKELAGQVDYSQAAAQEKATEVFTHQPTKELKLEDINRVLPDYTDVNNQHYDTTGKRMMAEAHESYKAHAKQIEQDLQYYFKDGGQYSTKVPQNYALAMLEARKKIMEDDSYDWSRYAMLQRAERPIYQYGKESHITSFIKGAGSFATNMLTSAARTAALTQDVNKGLYQYNSVQGDDIFSQINRNLYNINDNDSDYDMLNKTFGQQLAYTTKSYRDINRSLDYSLGVGVNEKTNPLSYSLGQAAANVAVMFGTLGIGSMMKTVQAANAIRNVAGNLVCALYGASAFQSYSLDALNAGKDPLKAHAAGMVNGVLNVIIEGMQWRFIKARIGNGTYSRPTEMLKAFKTMGSANVMKAIYKDSIAAGMLSEGLEEGLQQTVEHGLKLMQGIEDMDAATIIADIAQSMLLGALLSAPMAHIATNSQFKARNYIAQRFVGMKEEDAKALAYVLVAHGEQLAKDEFFQRELTGYLRDNILNLKPADAGQDTQPLSDSGIVAELEETSAQATLGNDNFDTMVKNGQNLKTNLFDLLTNKERAEELRSKMMETTKMIKKYATKYMGLSNEEADVVARIMQDNIFAIAVTTDMPARQIFNAVMPKIHNRSMVSALNGYKSADKGALNLIKRFRFKNNQSIDNLYASAETLKGIMSKNVSLTDLIKASSEGKELNVTDEERSIAELKSMVQREAAIQQQIRKQNGESISYNQALDIALYKILGANENTIAQVFGTDVAFKNEEKHESTRTKQILSSIDITNEDFLGIQNYAAVTLQEIQQRKGTQKAGEELAERQMEFQAGILYANRAREIIDRVKKDKNYKLTKQDYFVLTNAIKLADMQAEGKGIYGMHIVAGQVNPLIILDRVASRETTIHEFSHHIVKSVIGLNNYMKEHTGYHLVYFNNLINGINNLFKTVYGKELSIVNKDGTLNEEASELFATIIEDYVSGELKIDDDKFTDEDKKVLNSVLDSYNNAIRAAEKPASGVSTPEQKKAADNLIADVMIKKSVFTQTDLSTTLVQRLFSLMSDKNISNKDFYDNLKAIYKVAEEAGLLTYPAEQMIWLAQLEGVADKKVQAKLAGNNKADFYIVSTSLLSDITATSLSNTVTEQGPDQNIETSKGIMAGGHGRKGIVVIENSIKQAADNAITKAVKEANNNLSKKNNVKGDSFVKELLLPEGSKVLDSKGRDLGKVIINSTLDAFENNEKYKKDLIKVGRLLSEKGITESEYEGETDAEDLAERDKALKDYDNAINEAQDKVLNHVKELLSKYKLGNQSDLNEVATALTNNIINNFVENNKDQFEKEFYNRTDNTQSLVEDEAKEMQESDETKQELEDNKLSLTDKRTGIRYIFNKDRVSEYFKGDKEGDFGGLGRIVDLLNLGKDKYEEAVGEGKIDKDTKDFEVNFKRSAEENYEEAKNKLSETSDPESGKKGKDVMTPTELETESQDIIREEINKQGGIKDINTVLVIKDDSFKSKVKEKASQLNKILTNFTGLEPIKYFAKGMEAFKNAVVPLSVRLDKIGGFSKDGRNINAAYRRAYWRGQMASKRFIRVTNNLLEKIQPFVKNESKQDDYLDFYSSLLTDSKEARDNAMKYAQREGFEKELMDVFALLDECKKLRIKWREFTRGLTYYFPRHLVNVKEFMMELCKDPDSELGKVINAKGGIPYLQSMDNETIMTFYKKEVMRDMKNSKHRVLDVMKPKYIKYYSPLGDALHNYFKEQVDLIIRDSFMSGVKITTKAFNKLHEAYKENPFNTSEGWYDILKQMGYLDPTNNYRNKNNAEIVKIIDALFFRARTSKFVSFYRDVMSALLLSNPVAALENFKDICNIADQFGLQETLKSLAQSTKDMKKSEGKLDGIEEGNVLNELTVETINSSFREITLTGMKPVTEWLRKWSGFAAADSLNKITFIRTVASAYKKRLSKKGSKEYVGALVELRKIFNGDMQAVNNCMEALQQDISKAKNSEDFMFFIYSKMCENYALNPAEMPYYYNVSTYGRLFYIFKNQTLKTINRVVSSHMDNFTNAKTPEARKKAWVELVKTLLYFSLCGVPVEALKDILGGIPMNTLPEYTFYNIMGYAMMSEYTVMRMKENGLVSGFMTAMLPPEAFDRLLRLDLSALPIFGRPLKGVYRIVDEI